MDEGKMEGGHIFAVPLCCVQAQLYRGFTLITATKPGNPTCASLDRKYLSADGMLRYRAEGDGGSNGWYGDVGAAMKAVDDWWQTRVDEAFRASGS